MELQGLRQTSANPIHLTLGNAGHILGAAYIILEFEDQKIVYTGDINLSRQTLMPSADLSGFRNTKILILETTYGATDSARLGTLKSESKKFATAANKILHDGGSILVPVFALGKAQELLAMIASLMKSRILTESIIYTGGISREISNLYDHHRFICRLNNPEIVLRDIPQMNHMEISDLNYFKKNPGIVLASSGMMLQGTRSYVLMDYWLRQETFAIFGVGYMDEETPGYTIINSSKGASIQLPGSNETWIVHCAINKFYFPSHSKREELVKLTELANPEKVILVHGDYNAKRWVGEKILKSSPSIKVHAVENSKSYFI